MTTYLLIVIGFLGAVNLGLAIVLALKRSQRSAVEWPTDLNRDVLQRVAALEGSLGARLSTVDDRIVAFASMFSNSSSRGGWAELSLRQAFEHAGLVEGRDFEINRQHRNDGKRPDGVVKLPGGRKLIVDAKFPMARLADAAQVADAEARTKLMAKQARSILNMAKDLRGRGYRDEAAGGFVVMYLPDEGLYVQAMRAEPELFDKVYRQGVLLAGPATLLAMLGVTAQVLFEYRAVDDAHEIVTHTKELLNRLGIFVKHFDDLGKKLNTTVKGYNQAVGSWANRLEPQVSRIAEYTPGEAIPAIEQIEAAARELNSASVEPLSAIG